MNLNMETNGTVSTFTDGQASVLQAKIVTMVCLFSISMAVGCVPMLISLKYDWFTGDKDLRSSNRLIKGLLAFGGGVLFETTFMHLLPEVDENIKLLQEAGELAEMPIYLAALIMCSGFFMMYLVEELVHLYIHNREKSSSNEADVLSTKSHSPDVSNNVESQHDSYDRRLESKRLSTHFPPPSNDGVVSALRGLLIVLALSIHELFEGLAVGLESSAANVWYMFGAVSAHKYLIAFCIGVEFLAAKTRRWLSILYIFTFSFVSALGIAVGILLVGGAGASDAGLYSVVLQGIACGTLVYVVFYEVWKNQSGLLQFSCALLGFTVMVCIQVIVELAA